MEKPATTDWPVEGLLARRWSPRSFSSEPVSEDALRSLLEAARWAPSCFNAQPWRFLVATSAAPDEHARMVSMLTEGNRRWAATAPVLMIAVAETTFAHNGKPNRWAAHDVGLAMGQLGVEATARGLSLHQMGGILPDLIRDSYGLPDTAEPLTGVAIGWPAAPEALPEDLVDRERAPRVRHPQADFVFTGRWGQPR